MIPEPENLDAMSEPELTAFYERTRTDKDNAVRALATYANMKRTAMQCRVRGRLMQAQMFEEMCDEVYSKLPDEFRW